MIKHFLGEKTLTVVVGNRPRAIDRKHPFYGEILAGVSDPLTDEAWLLDLLDPLNPLRDVVIDGESIKIEQTTVTRNGEPLPNYLQERIVDTVRAGLPVDGWKLFVERVYANPSFQARDELAKFMEKSGLTMTPEGKFVAFKRVNEDYTDCYTGTFDNSVGRTVVMPGGRRAVDNRRDRTCSNGLHVCSQAYLRNFYAGRGRIVIVEVDPADVVSVPYDYNNTKARVWRYTVVGEVPLSTESEAKEWGVISLDYLNREALDLVNANIERIQDLIEDAEATGDETEQAEQEEALSQAIDLKVRIETKLAEDQRVADEAYAAQVNAELDEAEALAEEHGVTVEEAIHGVLEALEIPDGETVTTEFTYVVGPDGEAEVTLSVTLGDEDDEDYDGPAIWGGYVYDDDEEDEDPTDFVDRGEGWDDEDDPDDMALYPIDPEFQRLLDEEEEIERGLRAQAEISVSREGGASGPYIDPDAVATEKLSWGDRLRRKIGLR